MEPEPEDEEQAAAAAATEEAPDGSAVLAARVGVAGHEVAVDSTALDVRRWKLTAAQVREVAGALPQLLCLRELVLDGVPVSGATPRYGDFQCGVEAVDADLGMFQALCEALRALQGLTSLSLGGCYLGPQALAVLAEVVFRDASAVLASLTLSGNRITDWDRDLSGLVALGEAIVPSKTLKSIDLSDCGIKVKGVTEVAKFISAGAAVTSINCLANQFGDEGLATLLTAIKGTSVRSLCGLTEGQTAADFSGQNLGPIDCKIISAEFEFRGFIAVVKRVVLSQNFLFGNKYGGYWR
jgi:hypothetical protein